jgi:ATP-dependent Lon protease
MPIGGLKEKLLAALRAGIKTVVIPEENVKDLAEIGEEVKSPLEIIAASRMDDVLKVALLRMPTPITVEEEAAATVAAEAKEEPRITAH